MKTGHCRRFKIETKGAEFLLRCNDPYQFYVKMKSDLFNCGLQSHTIPKGVVQHSGCC